MASNNVTYIGGRLKSAAKNDPYVAESLDIFDENLQKNQQTINSDAIAEGAHLEEELAHLEEEVADRYTKAEVNNIVSRTSETDVIVMDIPSEDQDDIAGYLDAHTPSGSTRANKLYRVPGPTNETYSEWAWDGTAYIMLANKDYGIDNVPIPESDNTVKSGGVAKTLELTEVHLKGISPLMEDIYTSTSNNHLDVSNVATGVYIDARVSGGGAPTLDPKGVISRFIYVKGIEEVTVSCTVANDKLSILFLTKPILDVQYKTNVFSFTGLVRTISVPSDSEYAVVCLREPNFYPDYDYSGVKLSFTDSAATQEYQGRYLGRAGFEYLFDKTIVTADDISGTINTVKETREDVNALQSATTKDASLTYNTSFGPDTDSAKVLINIEAGQKYKICVRDFSDDVISEVYAVYKIIDGQRSTPVLTQFQKNTISQEFTAEEGLDGLAFYIDRNDILKSGVVELAVFNVSRATDKRLDAIEENERKVFDSKVTKPCVSTGVIINMPYVANTGEMLSFRVNSDEISGFYYYVKYSGDDDYTRLGYSIAVNEIVTVLLSSAITNMQVYMPPESIISAEGNVELEDCRSMEGTVETHTDSINELTDDVERIDSILHPFWEKTISLSFGYIDPSHDVTAWLPVKIKAGDKFTVELQDADNKISAVNAFYAVYKGTTERVNLGLVDIESNEKYDFVASQDIDYICVYVYSDNIVSYPVTVVLRTDGEGLVDKAGDGSVTDITTQKYQEIFKQVANDAMMRFIPFSVTVPTANMMHQTDDEFIKNFNVVFFTDSHIDYKCPDESLQNVRDTISFVNAAKRKMALISSNINEPLFDAVIHAGDIITSPSGRSKQSALAYAKSFFDITEESGVPVLFAAGNHDRNDNGNPPSSAFTFADWATLYGNYAAEHYGIVRGTKNGDPAPWFYKDFPDKKIRVVSVFVNDVDESAVDGSGNVLYNESKGWYIAQDQMNWLVNTALKFDLEHMNDSDWGVIVFLHQSVEINSRGGFYGCRVSPAFESSIGKFFEVCKAFNAQGTYSNNYTFATNHFFDLEIDADFSDYASTKKWDSYDWNANAGVGKEVKCTCFRKQGDTLTVKMEVDSGTLTQYYLYVKYAGDSGYTQIQQCNPNEEVSVVLIKDVEKVSAYANGTDVTTDVEATFNILQKKPHIICWLNGHEHRDYSMVKEGINIIWTAQGSAMTGYGDFSVPRLFGTPTQNLFDLMSIDTLHRTIRMVRCGAGANCFGNKYPWGDRFISNPIEY